jgi:HSP20 family protein
MNELSLWKNQQMVLLRKDLDRLFDRWWTLFGQSRPGKALPSVDVAESGEALVVKAEVPGFQPEELEVSLSEEELTIRGRRTIEGEAKGNTVLKKGLQSFSRTIRLPYMVNHEGIEAFYEEGMLTVRMPKRTSRSIRRVEITVK